MNMKNILTSGVSRRSMLKGMAALGFSGVAATFAGCASDGASSDGGSGDGSADATLVLSLPSSPRYLDPTLYTGTYESQVINCVCDTLVEYKMDLSEIGPNLATDWTISEDGVTYTFTLRDDVHFQVGEYQDGRLMTAEDVKFSLERSANESAMNRLSMLDHCNVISDTEIECVLKEPAASFITALTDAGNVIVPKEEVEGWGDDFGSHLVGTGPFALQQFVLDQQSDLVRNDAYWGPTPNLAGVTIRVITDQNQAANALATGEIQMATSMTGEAIQTVKNNADLVMNQTEGLHVAYVYFNQVNGPTADQNVRRAILMAIDRSELVAGVYPYGEAIEASLPLPRGSWAYDESIEELVPAYDPEGARELLAQTDYADGMELNLYISNTEARNRMATIIQQSLSENLGITVNIHASDWGTFSESAASGTADMYGMSWTWYPDPYFFLNQLFSSTMVGALGNGAGFTHEEVDELLTLANSVTDQEERAAYYQDALRAIMGYDPILVYATEYVNTGMSPAVEGYVQRADNKVIICNGEVNVSLAS